MLGLIACKQLRQLYTVLVFASAYQLLLQPIVDSVLSTRGEPLNRDIYDLGIWRALGNISFQDNLLHILLNR